MTKVTAKLLKFLSVLILLQINMITINSLPTIYPHNAFHALSSYPDSKIANQDYRFCFQNLENKTRYINLRVEDTLVKLNDYINIETIIFHEMGNPINKVNENPNLSLGEKAESPELKNQLSVKVKNKIVIDKSIKPSTSYCISFKTVKSFDFKNLTNSISFSSKSISIK